MSDLARGQPHRPTAALDLVPEELDVDDPRLLRIDVHAQLLQDLARHLQRDTGCGGANRHGRRKTAVSGSTGLVSILFALNGSQ